VLGLFLHTSACAYTCAYTRGLTHPSSLISLRLRSKAFYCTAVQYSKRSVAKLPTFSWPKNFLLFDICSMKHILTRRFVCPDLSWTPLSRLSEKSPWYYSILVIMWGPRRARCPQIKSNPKLWFLALTDIIIVGPPPPFVNLKPIRIRKWLKL